MDLGSDPVNCAVIFTIESGDHLHMFDIIVNLYMFVFLQVMTMDLDSDPVNCAVNFTIESGDHLHMFDIIVNLYILFFYRL